MRVAGRERRPGPSLLRGGKSGTQCEPNRECRPVVCETSAWTRSHTGRWQRVYHTFKQGLCSRRQGLLHGQRMRGSMNIEEFRAAFTQALAPLVEFAKHVRDIFLELAQRLRKALVPLWTNTRRTLRHRRKRGSRQERRRAWNVLHEARRHRQIRATAPHRLKRHPAPCSA